MLEPKSTIDEKLNLAKSGILARYRPWTAAIFAVGSIVHEPTSKSDLDIVTVIEDSYFTDSIAEIKAYLKELSSQINEQYPEHELVLWASKRDHFRTYLPDVSYVRANLPASLERLDAWCGLAKHTLAHYEAAANLCLYGDSTLLDRGAFPRIPPSEARELFLLATRTFAQGLHEMCGRDNPNHQAGMSHIAKACLRAAYAVLVRQTGEPLAGYKAIHSAAVSCFPEVYRPLLDRMYEAKSALAASGLPLTAMTDFLHYCEAAIATAPRLTFSGVTPGMRGESFAFPADSILQQDVPGEKYSRFADARANHIHLLYFLLTAKEIVQNLSDIEWPQGTEPVLDFFFEEIAIVAIFALLNPGRLRVVVGRLEREPLDLFFDDRTIQQLAGLVRTLVCAYAKASTDNAFSLPWLSHAQKAARLTVILDTLRGLPNEITAADILPVVHLNPSTDDYIDALLWAGRSLVGLFNPKLLRMQSEIAMKLYQGGAVEAARSLLEGIIHGYDIKDAAEEEARGVGVSPSEGGDLLFSTVFHYYAIVLHRLGKLAEAKSQYLKALALSPDNISALADLAMMLMTRIPDDQTATFLVGLADRAGERRTDALQQVSAQFIGHALRQKRRREYDDALAWYLRAREIDAQNDRLYYNIGLLYEDVGRMTDAIQMYRTSMSINPNYVNPYVRLAMLLEDQDIDAAMELLVSTRTRGIADAYALANLGNCYWKKGTISHAEECYREALNVRGDHPDALNGLANVLISRYQASGDVAALREGVEYYRKALDAEPEFYGARVNYRRAAATLERAEAAVKQGRHRESEKAFAGARLAEADITAIDHLVYKLDEVRRRTGSFVVHHGDDEVFISRLCEAIVASPSVSMLLNSMRSRIPFGPDDDLIFRSDLVGVRHEPRSMQSVFVPRDTKRDGFYMPYFIYALGKLEQNLKQEAVQRELSEAGYDVTRVSLAPIIQIVGGARDTTNAVGRERTVSYSARLDFASDECTCNVVFGLPLLATRPHWNGTVQAATFKCRVLSVQRGLHPGKSALSFDWRGPGNAGFKSHDSLRRSYKQTHKAVLIPEKGIEYETLDFLAGDVLYELKGGRDEQKEEVYFPIPRELCEQLLAQFSEIARELPRSEQGTQGWRCDGVLTRQESGSWDPPSFVGLSAISCS